MKNFEIKYNDFSFSGAGYDSSEIVEIIKAIKEGSFNKEETSTVNIKNESKPKKAMSAIEDEPPVEYDLRELRSTMRMPKATSDFRCPFCSQGILMTVDPEKENIQLVRDITGERAHLYKIDIESYPKMWNDIDNAQENEKVINVYREIMNCFVDEDSETVCITDDSEQDCNCPICGYTNPMVDWIKEFENPSVGSHNICDICGEAGNIQIDADGTDYISCTKDCVGNFKNR